MLHADLSHRTVGSHLQNNVKLLEPVKIKANATCFLQSQGMLNCIFMDPFFETAHLLFSQLMTVLIAQMIPVSLVSIARLYALLFSSMFLDVVI